MHFSLSRFAIHTALAVGMSLAALPAYAATWRLSSMMPETSFEGQAFVKFAELAEKYTEGRVTVRIYPNEQLGKIEIVLDQLKDGTIQLAPTQVSFLAQYVPAFVYTSAPFLFSDYAQWAKFMHGDLVKGWVKEVEEKGNIKILGDISALRRGSFRVMLSKAPMEDINGFKGLKMRQYQDELIVDAWTYLGTDTRIIAWTDTYDAVSRGIVDALTSPAELVESNRFYEVAPYITRTNEFPQAVSFMMNKTAYEALSDADKLALERAQLEASAYGVRLVDEQAKVWEARMKELGATVNMDFDIQSIVEKLKPFYEDRAKSGMLPEGFLEAIEQAKSN